jgi:histidinol-phosphate phosphatase family protein
MTGPGPGPCLAPPAGRPPWDLVLLDRDGTLNERVDGYVDHPDRLRMLPGAASAVRRLNEAGCRVVLVTNQRGLATGRLSWGAYEEVTARLHAELAARGAHLDRVELCPHDEGTCDCRKPRDGLFRRALAAAPWADPRRCAMIGDMPSDVHPARGLGMRGLLLGEDAEDLVAAVDELLSS